MGRPSSAELALIESDRVSIQLGFPTSIDALGAEEHDDAHGPNPPISLEIPPHPHQLEPLPLDTSEDKLSDWAPGDH